MKKRIKQISILMLTQLVLLSSLSCHSKKGKVDYLGRENSVSSYSIDDAKVLIVDPENIDAALNVKEEEDALVLDMRYGNNPGIKVIDSHLIDDTKTMRQIVDAIQDYNNKIKSDKEWNRNSDSMVIEWELHNILYNLGLFNSHTEDVDFNQSELANILK